MKHVKTKRLTMFPMTIPEIDDLISKETNEELVKEYIKMKSIYDNDNYRWNSIWKICLKENGEMIGEFHFDGLSNACTQMNYNIFEEYWGQGYTYEVLDAMVSYALSQDEVYFLEMLINSNDEYKINALEKLKFKKVNETKGKIMYALEKPKSRLLIIFIAIGLCIGVAIGIGLNSVWIGGAVGACLGAIIGASIDKADDDKRKEFQEKRINDLRNGK